MKFFSITLKVIIICMCMCGISRASIGIELNQTTWNVGEGAAGEWTSPQFVVTNPGTEPAKLNIRATNTQKWQLADAPAQDKYSLLFSPDGSNWTPLATINKVANESLVAEGQYTFRLKYQSPTSLTDLSLVEMQNSAVTLSVESSFIGSWEIHTVDSEGSVGRWASLEVDNLNNAHISYYDQTNGNVKYAKWAGDTWDVQVVDSEGLISQHALSLDVQGRPHIVYSVYMAPGDSRLKYAYWNGYTWIIDTITSGKYGYGSFSFAIDKANVPHILCKSYDDVYPNVLKYITMREHWSIIDVDYGVKDCTIMDIDTDNLPHIAYITTLGVLKYGKLENEQWAIEGIANVDNDAIANKVSLIVDSQNRPHIAYNAFRFVKYAKYIDGLWQTSDIYEGQIHSLAIAIDDRDMPAIAYSYLYFSAPSSSHGSIDYVRYTGTTWDTMLIVRGGGSIYDMSMQIDKDNNPHIAYYQIPYNDLKYARFIR